MRDNHEDWTLLMLVKLEAIWDVVEQGDADRQEDSMALDVILSSMPVEMIRTLKVKKTSKEAWEAIKSIHVGSDIARKWTTSASPLRLDEFAEPLRRNHR